MASTAIEGQLLSRRRETKTKAKQQPSFPAKPKKKIVAPTQNVCGSMTQQSGRSASVANAFLPLFPFCEKFLARQHCTYAVDFIAAQNKLSPSQYVSLPATARPGGQGPFVGASHGLLGANPAQSGRSRNSFSVSLPQHPVLVSSFI